MKRAPLKLLRSSYRAALYAETVPPLDWIGRQGMRGTTTTSIECDAGSPARLSCQIAVSWWTAVRREGAPARM
jgi:hypothetical protein